MQSEHLSNLQFFDIHTKRVRLLVPLPRSDKRFNSFWGGGGKVGGERET